MEVYGGNLYLLDRKANQIWKYVGAVGEPKAYLAAEVQPDFSASAALGINGAIYVPAGNQVYKFSLGRREEFSLTGLDKPTGKITLIAAADDLQNIYLWDEPNRRVVVVSETGQYQSQYIIDGQLSVTGLFANESLGKIFLLSGSKVYAVTIK
jgi:hypothetical protein